MEDNEEPLKEEVTAAEEVTISAEPEAEAEPKTKQETEEDKKEWLISTAPDWRYHAMKYLEETRFTFDNDQRLEIAEFNIRMLLQFSERQARRIKELERINNKQSRSIDSISRDLSHFMSKCHKYESIAKEKAKRDRKLPKDHSGYSCIGSREFQEKYCIEFLGRVDKGTVIAYRTMFETPYLSSLGYEEIRHLIEVDFVGGGKEGLYSIPGRAYVMGIDYVYQGMPNDGKHPGPETLSPGQRAQCILYRMILNLGKKYAVAEVYTTASLIIPPEYFA